MNVLWFLIPAIVILVLASRTYGVHLARVFGVDDNRPTPAALHDDNRDLVRTRVDVVFAHHFASIAGTGPIIGPVFALVYGFFPIWVWVLVGGIFLGAVHDFGSLFVSMREGAKSIPTVVRKTLGKTGYVLFILFFLSVIVLITSAFLNMAAVALTTGYPIEQLQLAPDQNLLRTETASTPQGGTVTVGIIGGIAATGVIVITLLSIPLGWLQRRQVLKGVKLHLVGTAICLFSIFVGFMLPVQLPRETWIWALAVYTFLAAGLPVWLIVQPRDMVNVQILYGGMALLLAALLFGGATGAATAQYPAVSVGFGGEMIGMLWPFLFITVACGAISGFHCMVAGGTTSRQLARESDSRRIAYNGMLLESLLAILVTLALAASLTQVDYRALVWPTPEEVQAGARSNPIFAFALAAGMLFHNALGIPLAIGCVFGILTVGGFIVTTLDTAVRLNRYLFEELWDIVFDGKPPAFMKFYWFNAGLSVALMLLFAMQIKLVLGWLLFGTANQLVAALALIAVTAWLLAHGRRFLYTLIPALLMLVTTMTALLLEVFGTYPPGQEKNALYEGSAIFMAILAVGVIVVTVWTLLFRPRASVGAPSAAEP